MTHKTHPKKPYEPGIDSASSMDYQKIIDYLIEKQVWVYYKVDERYQVRFAYLERHNIPRTRETSYDRIQKSAEEAVREYYRLRIQYGLPEPD